MMNTQEQIAKILLKIKAVAINTQEPYTYNTGIKSPIYCDNRLLLSKVDEREKIVEYYIKKIEEAGIEAEVIARHNELGQGKIEITFNSEEDIARILEVLNG